MQNYYYDERVTKSLNKSNVLMDIFTFINEIEESTSKNISQWTSAKNNTQSWHFNNAQIMQLLELIDTTKCKKQPNVFLQFLFNNNIRINNVPLEISFKKKIIKQFNNIFKKSKNKILEELLCLYAIYTMRFHIENPQPLQPPQPSVFENNYANLNNNYIELSSNNRSLERPKSRPQSSRVGRRLSVDMDFSQKSFSRDRIKERVKKQYAKDYVNTSFTYSNKKSQNSDYLSMSPVNLKIRQNSFNSDYNSVYDSDYLSMSPLSLKSQNSDYSDYIVMTPPNSQNQSCDYVCNNYNHNDQKKCFQIQTNKNNYVNMKPKSSNTQTSSNC